MKSFKYSMFLGVATALLHSSSLVAMEPIQQSQAALPEAKFALDPNGENPLLAGIQADAAQSAALASAGQASPNMVVPTSQQVDPNKVAPTSQTIEERLAALQGKPVVEAAPAASLQAPAITPLPEPQAVAVEVPPHAEPAPVMPHSEPAIVAAAPIEQAVVAAAPAAIPAPAAPTTAQIEAYLAAKQAALAGHDGIERKTDAYRSAKQTNSEYMALRNAKLQQRAAAAAQAALASHQQIVPEQMPTPVAAEPTIIDANTPEPTASAEERAKEAILAQIEKKQKKTAAMHIEEGAAAEGEHDAAESEKLAAPKKGKKAKAAKAKKSPEEIEALKAAGADKKTKRAAAKESSEEEAMPIQAFSAPSEAAESATLAAEPAMEKTWAILVLNSDESINVEATKKHAFNIAEAAKGKPVQVIDSPIPEAHQESEATHANAEERQAPAELHDSHGEVEKEAQVAEIQAPQPLVIEATEHGKLVDTSKADKDVLNPQILPGSEPAVGEGEEHNANVKHQEPASEEAANKHDSHNAVAEILAPKE